MGESPRWHDGRLWLSDWGTGEILALDDAGDAEVMARLPALPFCFDFLPDGRLLVVSGREGLLLRHEPDGSVVTHADLTRSRRRRGTTSSWTRSGNAYVGCTGFDFPGAEFAPGLMACVTPGGAVREVADGVAFPNGVAITPDGGDARARRVLRQVPHGVGHRSRRRALRPPRLGGPRRRRARRHLLRRRGRRSGTPTSRTGAASAWRRAARSSRPSTSTAGASRACSAAPTAGRCTSSRRSGAGRRRSRRRPARGRCSRCAHRPRTPGGPSRHGGVAQTTPRVPVRRPGPPRSSSSRGSPDGHHCPAAACEHRPRRHRPAPTP